MDVVIRRIQTHWRGLLALIVVVLLAMIVWPLPQSPPRQAPVSGLLPASEPGLPTPATARPVDLLPGGPDGGSLQGLWGGRVEIPEMGAPPESESVPEFDGDGNYHGPSRHRAGTHQKAGPR